MSSIKNLNIENKLSSRIMNHLVDGIEVVNDSISYDIILNDIELMKEIHHILFEIHIQNGFLICPESNRKFPIKDGIPNMLLHEDEV